MAQTIGANSSGSKTVSDCIIKNALRLTKPSIKPIKFASGKAPKSSIFLRSIGLIKLPRFISLCFSIVRR